MALTSAWVTFLGQRGEQLFCWQYSKPSHLTSTHPLCFLPHSQDPPKDREGPPHSQEKLIEAAELPAVIRTMVNLRTLCPYTTHSCAHPTSYFIF